MTPISFIYFDLDDTLLDHRLAEQRALRDVFSRFGSDLGASDFDKFYVAYRAINPEVWRAYSDGDLDKEAAKRERFIRLIDLFEQNCVPSPDELSTYYLGQYSLYWSYLPGAQEALLALSNRYNLGILTNGFSEVQRQKLNQFHEIRDACSIVVISDEVGCMKPHAGIFTHATEMAKCPRNEILYVGDSLRSDVQGGLAAGWQVAWLTDDESHELNAFKFSRWHELTDKLLETLE